MVGRPHFYLFVSLEGVRSRGARLQRTLDLPGRGGWGVGGFSRRKALQRESHGELANKLASDGERGGRGGVGGAAVVVVVVVVLGGVGIHLARHSCSCLWLSLTASATQLQSTCVCSLAFPQSARKML